MRVRRFDAGTIGEIQRTPSGGVVVPARLTRVGVFPYRLSDGSIRRELRLPEEVFAPQSLMTLPYAAVTENHPPIDVNPANWKDVTVGMVGERIGHDEKYVEAPIIINTEATIGKVDSGELRDVSCGYNCVVDMASGEYNGERYDAIQRQIRYNHVALLPPNTGRAGPDVGLRLDSGDAILAEGSEKMKLKIGGKTVELTEAEAQAHFDKLQKRADAADPKAIRRRVDMMGQARLLAKKYKRKLDEEALAEMAEPDLLVQMIQIVRPDFNPEGKSEDYVKGVFESTIPMILEEYVAQNGAKEEPEAVEEPSEESTPDESPDEPAALDSKYRKRDSNVSRPVFGARLPPVKDGKGKRTDANEDEGDKAYREMIERQQNRWKKVKA